MLVPFDTLNYTRKLEAAGFSREQAEAQAETQSHALGEFFRHQDEKFIQTLATKDDLYDSRLRAGEALDNFKTDVSGEFNSLRDNIYGSREEARKEFQSVRGEIQALRNELQEFKDETRREFQNVRAELQEFKDETRREFQNVRGEIQSVRNELQEFKEETRREFQSVRGEIQSVRNELQEFKEETRREFQNVRESMGMLENRMMGLLSDFRHDLVKWFIGTLIGLTGVAIGIGSFVLAVWFK